MENNLPYSLKKFQFLIGRLKINWKWKIFFFLCMFQFLIGRLKMCITPASFQTLRYRFQFLIGRLKISQHVVNPINNPVFQFLIGRLKISIVLDSYNYFMPFQFLIGRLKITTKIFIFFAQLCVSIPHR